MARKAQIRLLHTDQCAPENTAAARTVLTEALADFGLDYGEAVEEILIETEDEAQERNFVGGPAIHVDGQDVDPAVREMQVGGLGCRAYITAEGYTAAPPKSMVLAALREAGFQ